MNKAETDMDASSMLTELKTAQQLLLTKTKMNDQQKLLLVMQQKLIQEVEKYHLLQNKISKKDYEKLKFYRDQDKAIKLAIDDKKKQIAEQDKRDADRTVNLNKRKISTAARAKDIASVSTELAQNKTDTQGNMQQYNALYKTLKHPEKSKRLQQLDTTMDDQYKHRHELEAQLEALKIAQTKEMRSQNHLEKGYEKQIRRNITAMKEELDELEAQEEVLGRILLTEKQLANTGKYANMVAGLRRWAHPTNTLGIMGVPQMHRISATMRLFAELLEELGAAIIPLAGLAGILLLVGKLVNDARQALKETIDIGLNASQRVAAMGKAYSAVGDALTDHAIISNKQAIDSYNALSERLGTLDIPVELIKKSAELNRQIGLSADDAGELLQYFTRIRGQSSDIAAKSADIVQATAIQNRMNPQLLMKDVAENAGEFAKNSRAGADEIGRAAVLARQMGVSLSTIGNLADKVVDDFQGTLEAQASINAIAPNFNMTGVMMASQFGTDADVAEELKSAIQGMGVQFDQLPRSMKNMIAQSLGMTVQELGNVMNDKKDAMSAGESAMVKATENVQNELQQAIAHPVDSLLGAVTSGFEWLRNRFTKAGAVQSVNKMAPEELKKAALVERGGFGMGGVNILDWMRGIPQAAQNKLQMDAIQKNLSTLQSLKNPSPNQQIVVNQQENALSNLQLESRAIGGTVGKDRAPKISLKNMLTSPKPNEVMTVLHAGETVFNPLQMKKLHDLLPDKKLPPMHVALNNQAQLDTRQMQKLHHLMTPTNLELTPDIMAKAASPNMPMPHTPIVNVPELSMQQDSPLLQTNPAMPSYAMAPVGGDTINSSTTTSTSKMVNTTDDRLLKELGEIRMLLQNGIVANAYMDGRKVSAALIDTNRYK